jgi:hypothetical protein
MFNTAVTRLLWKELRAQQAVWIAMAAELVLLQFWWGTIGHRSVDLNLLSVAFVLTGVFAMTSSALLFAGESEAKTDLFLRQMPFRRSDLIRGKLLFAVLAVAAFLIFSLVTTFIAGQMAGRYGGDSSSVLGDPSLFGTSIAGMWAWGLFYSLLTRKVVWTVVGAALTQIALGGLVHSGILNDFRFPNWSLYLLDLVIVLSVLAADGWLLQRWCSGESADQRSLNAVPSEGGVNLRIAEAPLPWLSAFYWSSLLGIVTALSLLLAFVLISLVDGIQVIHGPETLLIVGGAIVIASIVIFAISRWKKSLASVDSLSTQPRLGLLDQPFTLRRSGSLLCLTGLSGVAFMLGLVACYSTVALPFVVLMLLGPWSPSGSSSEIFAFLLLSIGSITALWIGTQWLKTGTLRGAGGWLSLLQLVLSIRQQAVRRFSPLFWIEARRAFPILLGGWAVLTLIGLYRLEMPDHAALSYIAIVMAALFCGLMTILPDRTHGTLAFLTERGVSPLRVLGTKAILWSCTLALMMIPPLGIQERVARLVVRHQPNSHDYFHILRQELEHKTAPNSAPFAIVADSAWHLISLLGGTFLIGMLAAAWIRRPILAGLAGFMLTLIWFAWVNILGDAWAPVLFPILVPLLLIGVGIAWTARPIVLEQTSWRSKLGQIGWGLFIAFVSLQGFFHFRVHEIPDLSGNRELSEMRNSRPAPLSSQASSWQHSSNAAQLDALIDDEAKRSSLTQPAGGLWGATNSFQTAIAELKLDEDACDLDGAFERLRKWHQLTELMAQNSHNEDGWVECLFARRVVLSAIRRWANHPKQTAERLEGALGKLPQQLYTTSGATVIDREYAEALQALETGVDPETTGTAREIHASPVVRWLLTRSGEKERVRRLIDLYYYASANANIQQAPMVGEAYTQWMISTRASAASLGVNLPWQLLNVRHRGQFEMAGCAEAATRLVLQLQAWRLKSASATIAGDVDLLNRFQQEAGRINADLTSAGKDPIDPQVFATIQQRLNHGPFPVSLAQLQTTYPLAPLRDQLTNESFHYEPHGFDRELRASFSTEIPAQQPVLYSLGVDEPRGVDLVTAPDGRVIYQARNARSHHPSHPFLPTSLVSKPARNPHAIRFVILGQDVDEDGLSDPRPPETPAAEEMESSLGGVETPPESTPAGLP